MVWSVHMLAVHVVVCDGHGVQWMAWSVHVDMGSNRWPAVCSIVIDGVVSACAGSVVASMYSAVSQTLLC